MANPILEQLNSLGSGATQSSQNGSSTSSNGPLPTTMDDPRMNAAKEYVSKHGGNPKAAFYLLCKEKGITDPVAWMNKILGGR